MAQALEEFEQLIETPLARGRSVSDEDVQRVKRTFRRKLQTLASDCLDITPSDMQINAVELTRR